MERLPVYILAGGQSTRFGGDKSRALVDGVPMIARVAAMARPFASRVTVVADRQDRYADLGLRTIVDAIPGAGPLAGLAAALGDLPADEPWMLLLSCDLLVVHADWVAALVASANPPATAFRGAHWEPLLAVYHRSIGNAVQAQLASGNRAMQRLLDDAGATALPLPADWPETLQANTQADHDRFTRCRRPGG